MKSKIELTKKYRVFVILIIIGIIFMLLPLDNQNEQSTLPEDASVVLEEKISELIEKTYAVDELSVILTYDTYGEKIIDEPIDSEQSVFGENNAPFVKSEKLPYVRGALIAVKNIDENTSNNIKNAIAVLLGINTNKVTVIYN